MSAPHKACAPSALVGLALALSAPAASAQTMEFVYTGSFSSADALNPSGSVTSDFAGTTPFLVTALFNASGPNLAAPLGVPGFVAYSPISATLTVGRDTYQFTTYDQDPIQGISVAIFDTTTPFGPGHFAAGILQNPLADGAGFIGDWASASTPFSASSLVPTVFTGYTGVGYGPGPDPHNGQPPAVVPISLKDASGKSFLLTLGNYDEEAAGNVQNTAELSAATVPEASTLVSLGLLALGLGGLVIAAKRKKAGTSL